MEVGHMYTQTVHSKLGVTDWAIQNVILCIINLELNRPPAQAQYLRHAHTSNKGTFQSPQNVYYTEKHYILMYVTEMSKITVKLGKVNFFTSHITESFLMSDCTFLHTFNISNFKAIHKTTVHNNHTKSHVIWISCIVWGEGPGEAQLFYLRPV